MKKPLCKFGGPPRLTQVIGCPVWKYPAEDRPYYDVPTLGVVLGGMTAEEGSYMTAVYDVLTYTPHPINPYRSYWWYANSQVIKPYFRPNTSRGGRRGTRSID